MEATAFGDTEGEVYDAGGVRLRLLAQAPDQPIRSSTAPCRRVPGPGPAPARADDRRLLRAGGGAGVRPRGERRVLGPGSFVLVPPGVAHTFANPGPAPARVLNIQQPAGLEQYLKEAAKRMAAGRPWSPAEMAEVASRYDFEPVPEER